MSQAVCTRKRRDSRADRKGKKGRHRTTLISVAEKMSEPDKKLVKGLLSGRSTPTQGQVDRIMQKYQITGGPKQVLTSCL